MPAVDSNRLQITLVNLHRSHVALFALGAQRLLSGCRRKQPMSLTDFACQQCVSIKEQESALRRIVIHAPVKIRLCSRRYLDDDMLVSLGKVGEGMMASIDDEVRPHLRTGFDASVFVITESTLCCYPLPLTIALNLQGISIPLGAASPLQEYAQLSLVPAMRLTAPVRFYDVKHRH